MKKTPVFDKILISFSILIIIPKKLSFDVLSSDFHEADGAAARHRSRWNGNVVHGVIYIAMRVRVSLLAAMIIEPLLSCR